LLALDLLAQAEHGEDSLAVCVSPEPEILDAINTELAVACDAMGPIALIGVPDIDTAMSVAEAFAPEHLQLQGAQAQALAPAVRNAGCVFVGTAAGTAFGDYVAGSNHSLPTGGSARFQSGLSVHTFRRRMSEVHIGDAAAQLAVPGVAIAKAEGFAMHSASMAARAK
jgi:histidinol dehydrogenase